MFARSLLYLLGIVSLAWIVYVSTELTSNENKYNPVHLFSQEDGSIIIVNELVDVNQLLSLHPTTNDNSTIIQSLAQQENYRIFISSERNHLLLESKDVITKLSLNQLFQNNSGLKFTGSNSFTYNNFKGEFTKKYCYLYTETFNRNSSITSPLVFDKNATGSIIEIAKTSFSTKDIYLKEQGVFEYKSLYSKNAIGTKVNDEAVFSSIISSGIDSYQFYEVDYLRTIDPTFSKSPMNDWIKTGLVQITLNGSTALITDYINGQNPINVLNEFANIEPKNDENAYFQNLQLSKLLPTNKDLFVYLLDDYVVLSSNKSLCERILADYKLGSTISQSPPKRLAIYDKLPKKVNHRIVEATLKQSTSISKNSLLTTTVLSGQIEMTTEAAKQSTKGKDIGEAISSFYSLNESQLFVLTQSNKLIYFDGDTKKWTKSFEGKKVGEPELIDLFANDKQQLLITTENAIHLIDINGNEVNGFPINLENQRTQLASTFYRWQGAGYFLIGIGNGKILQFDTKGRELNSIKTSVNNHKLKPVVWASANKPFLGVYDGSKFEMIDLLNRKSFRKFSAQNISHYANKPNEIILVGMENNQLISYSQKGEKAMFGKFENGEIVKVTQQLNNPTILIRSTSEIHLINSQGIEWSTIKVPFTVIDDISMHELANGNLIVSIVDGIENNVYLYGTNGQKWKQESWDASTKIEFHQSNSKEFKLFTIVDKLIVEYKQH